MELPPGAAAAAPPVAYEGLMWLPHMHRYLLRVRVERKIVSLGTFPPEKAVEAARLADCSKIVLHGPSAPETNFPASSYSAEDYCCRC
jgi:hypothetical protein